MENHENYPKSEMITHINGLIKIANDGKEGYKHAAEHVESVQLKTLFNDYSMQRGNFADVLKTELDKLGEKSENEGGDILGKLHRTWLDLKSKIISSDNKSILDTVSTGEAAAKESYEAAIKTVSPTNHFYGILSIQKMEVDKAVAEIEKLKLQYAEVK